MSYDFYLFEPDRDAHGNIRRYSRFLSENPDLLTRFQVESGSATPKLEQLAAKINAKIEEKEKFGIYYKKADTSLDRAMVVPVRHGSQDKMLYLLFDAATRSNLGLATDDFLWCYGDEDGNYLVETAWWKLEAGSRTGVGPSLEWLQTAVTRDRYMIISSKQDEQHYLQFMAADQFTRNKEQSLAQATQPMPDWVVEPTPADAMWRVEYREGDGDHHFGLYVNSTEQAHELATQWFDQAPEFKQHNWGKMKLQVTGGD